jgi:single-strand DNA-binding protein
MNKIILVGHVGRDPEIGTSMNQKSYARFRLAVNSPNNRTDWFTVVCFGKNAEFASQYLHKGRLVAVSGRMETSTVDDRELDRKITYYSVIADTLDALDKRQDRDSFNSNGMGDAAFGETSDDEFDPFADK